MLKQSQAIEVPKASAETVRRELARLGLLKKGLRPQRTETAVLFPVSILPLPAQKAILRKACPQLKYKTAKFMASAAKNMGLKSALRGKLSPKQLSVLNRAFDTIGDIAVLEIPEALECREREIAEALFLVNRSIKVVCKKIGAHSGEFRVLPVEVIAGEERTTTVHREAGCVFELDLAKVFFTPRLATERMRISRLIKKGEVIGALFAGIGPFPIVFAKHSGMAYAYAVELNPFAYEYMVCNIALNKTDNIEPILGDVRQVANTYLKGKCDRVVMPLPKGGENFLREAILCIKPKGGYVHFYSFSDAKNPYAVPLRAIKEAAYALGRQVRIANKRRVRSYSPGTVQVVIDFRVE